MAGTATVNSGKSNRRFVLLAIVLGLLGAVLVYATFSRETETGPVTVGVVADTPVVVAKGDIAARQVVTASMLEVRLVPADTRTNLAYADVNEVIGQATRFPIAANEQLLPSKLIPIDGTLGTSRSLSFTIPKGMRGIAINATEVQNVGGLVLPGDYVDILVVYDLEFPVGGDPTDLATVDSYLVHTLMQNVEVLSVSQSVVDTVPDATSTAGAQRIRNSEAAPLPDAVTVTLAVTPEQAQLLYLAESNGRIRLSVRAFGDSDESPLDYLIEPDIFPQNIPNPFEI